MQNNRTKQERKQLEKRNRVKSNNWQFWLIFLLPLIYIIVFNYLPMGGLLMAFKDFSPRKGIFGSDWVGLKWFRQFLGSPTTVRTLTNTLVLGVYTLVASFPIPILLAVALNEVKNIRFKKTVQMVTYAPYFISTVVLVGMLMQMGDMRIGILNDVLGFFGVDPINFFSRSSFRNTYVWSGVWQSTGYSAIIYIAALAGVDSELQEAAIVDGATRVKRIWHIDLPTIAPTIIILLIFNTGQVLNIGFEKVFLMQNPLNTPVSEIISTFVYKVGLKDGSYSFSTAVGLFNSVISFILLVIVNKISKKVTETSLW